MATTAARAESLWNERADDTLRRAAAVRMAVEAVVPRGPVALPDAQTLVVVCAPAATAADAGPPTCPESSDAPARYGARGACPAPPGRAGAGVRPVAGVAGLAPAAGGAGGCTMRGCVTCGRFAGASGRAGCGVLPGSSMRSRIVGGTNRPEGADGGATDAAAAMGVGGSSIVSSTTGGSSIWGGSGTITTGGASSMTTGGGGSTSMTGGGVAATSTRHFDGLVLDVRRRWRSGSGCRGLRGCIRLDRLDETRRTENRSNRLGRFGLFRRWRLLRGGILAGTTPARRTCRRPEARCFAVVRGARRTSARQLPRLCSRRSSARFRDRA